jgi:hypothetical protein
MGVHAIRLPRARLLVARPLFLVIANESCLLLVEHLLGIRDRRPTVEAVQQLPFYGVAIRLPGGVPAVEGSGEFKTVMHYDYIGALAYRRRQVRVTIFPCQEHASRLHCRKNYKPGFVTKFEDEVCRRLREPVQREHPAFERLLAAFVEPLGVQFDALSACEFGNERTEMCAACVARQHFSRSGGIAIDAFPAFKCGQEDVKAHERQCTRRCVVMTNSLSCFPPKREA